MIVDDSGAQGSSPLARGLPRCWEARWFLPRIIPARAGFTTPARPRAKTTRDHPRSRGVYAARSRSRLRSMGSSPLARGLPDWWRDPHDRLRIIPARAGFTLMPVSSSHTRRDHPRSRGVYAAQVAHDALSEVSSPLARGLPIRVDLDRALTRIIPARAGFTGGGLGVGHGGEDHPRSRGVYFVLRLAQGMHGGSSPLARGLRFDIDISFAHTRIIPARAGFTLVLTQTRTLIRDHPRSRGVYVGVSADRSAERGSSPLARGLLEDDRG